MSANDDAGTTFDGAIAELGRLMTAIARRTYADRAGNERRYDFGEVVSIAVTTAAANLGGVEELLAGRPGSWEADYVRQIALSTSPENELHRYRTAPVRVLLNPEEVFDDAGLRALFDDQDNEIGEDYHNGTEPDDGGENDAAVDARRHALEATYKADLDAYFTAYVETLNQLAIERGITVPVTVERISDKETETSDALAQELHEAALARTPLPATSH